MHSSRKLQFEQATLNVSGVIDSYVRKLPSKHNALVLGRVGDKYDIFKINEAF
jgi:hypothetical protein